MCGPALVRLAGLTVGSCCGGSRFSIGESLLAACQILPGVPDADGCTPCNICHGGADKDGLVGEAWAMVRRLAIDHKTPDADEDGDDGGTTQGLTLCCQEKVFRLGNEFSFRKLDRFRHG